MKNLRISELTSIIGGEEHFGWKAVDMGEYTQGFYVVKDEKGYRLYPEPGNSNFIRKKTVKIVA